MQKVIHKSDTRAFYDYGWLKTKHTFSFARYYNPERIMFGKLRVLNDDVIERGMGFARHHHDNMEIITIPLIGELLHTDSEGHKQVLKRGDVQIMSAGTGIYHSEYNNSHLDPVNLLQIWIFPKFRDIEPRYSEISYNLDEFKNHLIPLVSPVRNNSTLWINQDAYLSIGKFSSDSIISYNIRRPGNGVYAFIIEGKVRADDDDILTARDGIGIWDTQFITFKVEEKAEILLIEVPME